MAFKAVFFDWRGTLVYLGTELAWAQHALSMLGRDASEQAAQDVITRCTSLPDLADRLHDIDTDAARHKTALMSVFKLAGLDDDLAAAMYAAESDYRRNPFAGDVPAVLAGVKARGIQVGVISDIHFDLRPAFDDAGLGDLVDLYMLSFEQGLQKPDAAFFQAALDGLQLQAADVLMVGDRAKPDGGAVALGMTTLLLPPLTSVDDHRLHLVEKLLD